MGLKYTNFFDYDSYQSPDVKIITCVGCSSHLCLSNLVVSDNFSGTSGPAYLVDNLINVEVDSMVQETAMKTGVYLNNKVRCHQCKAPLGWYYKKALEPSEHYKEGKYVIEKFYIRFIPNNSCNSHLVEQAIKNKLRRRYSSTSAIATDDDYAGNHSAVSSRSNSSSSANSDYHNICEDASSLHSVSTANSCSSSESGSSYKLRSSSVSDQKNSRNYYAEIKPSTSPRYSLGHYSYNSNSFLAQRRYSQLDYRDVASGVFLNRIRIPGIDKDLHTRTPSLATTSSTSTPTPTPFLTTEEDES